MGFDNIQGLDEAELNLMQPYKSTEELYEAIKNIKFEAGIPELAPWGGEDVIVFPRLDRNNQVWIVLSEDGKYRVLRSTDSLDISLVDVDSILSKLTFGLSDLSASFGKKKKRCMELVAITAKQIEAAGV